MIFDKLSRRWSAALTGFVALLLASSAQAEYALNMTESVTPLGRDLQSPYAGLLDLRSHRGGRFWRDGLVDHVPS